MSAHPGLCLGVEGKRVSTFATEPAGRADRRRVVCVAVTASGAEDQERLQERCRLLLDEVCEQVRWRTLRPELPSLFHPASRTRPCEAADGRTDDKALTQ